MAATVDQKLLKSTKFPPEFNQKVNMAKVKVPVIEAWAVARLTELLKHEDDVVTEMCCDMLRVNNPNIKEIQIALTGFLNKDSAPFCLELWKLCLSAQESDQGVPKDLLEAKKMELMKDKEAEEAAKAARNQRQMESTHEREGTRDRESPDETVEAAKISAGGILAIYHGIRHQGATTALTNTILARLPTPMSLRTMVAAAECLHLVVHAPDRVPRCHAVNLDRSHLVLQDLAPRDHHNMGRIAICLALIRVTGTRDEAGNPLAITRSANPPFPTNKIAHDRQG
ncbi:hypothetical protein LTR28_007494 [Elasticomyces elasticus]|nr:hypothetical protein LTR28_007494 [Elasticomyces elasticus]